MFYLIEHVTAYRYSEAISESQMEVRMQPRTEGAQRCWDFQLKTNPRSKVAWYRDPLGNIVHHFDVPGRHTHLTIAVEALIEMGPVTLPSETLGPTAWDELRDLGESDADAWEMLQPSRFACQTEALDAFTREAGLGRLADPLATMFAFTRAVGSRFTYAPKSTRVDSPIDEALASRRGVCQDFAHILISLGRSAEIPCRYVSGYLFHRPDDTTGSAHDATHAWVEALMPGLGWVGFDPTNDLAAAERHIRVAVGRDYADVPPTRGVFKGHAQTETALHVAVRVAPSAAPLPDEPVPAVAWSSPPGVQEAQQQ
jgi:transglutaminase-like putative cysteine protease